MQWRVLGFVGAWVVALSTAGVAGAAAPVNVTLTTTSATPAVGAPWKWTIVARNAKGKPVAARAKIQILIGKAVVGCWRAGAMAQCSGAKAGDPIAFTGKRSGVIIWPAQSRGVGLTFRALVTAKGRTKALKAPVKVR